MAIGDQNDFLARLKMTLPPWFPDATPVLDAVLSGWATTWAFVYSLFSYAKLQTRIRTATDGWLDMIAGDFFGASLQRRTYQTEAAYRSLILTSLLRERATRNALIKIGQDITGRTPILIEPKNPSDSGAYSSGISFYGSAGQYGSLLTNKYECFLKVFRPLVGTQWYGIPDADIYAAVDSVRPNNVTVWVQILN